MRRAALLALVPFLAGCGAGPGTAGGTNVEPTPPAKCSACHMPPRRDSLTVREWPAFLKAHERRLRLTEQEKAFLHDFLMAPAPVWR